MNTCTWGTHTNKQTNQPTNPPTNQTKPTKQTNNSEKININNLYVGILRLMRIKMIATMAYHDYDELLHLSNILFIIFQKKIPSPWRVPQLKIIAGDWERGNNAHQCAKNPIYHDSQSTHPRKSEKSTYPLVNKHSYWKLVSFPI